MTLYATILRMKARADGYRGLPIDKPKRLFKPSKSPLASPWQIAMLTKVQPRAVAAPSAVVAGSATFCLRGCNRGGDGK